MINIYHQSFIYDIMVSMVTFKVVKEKLGLKENDNDNLQAIILY